MPTTPRPYAAETTVSAARTKAEIETLLTRYGVTSFVQGWNTPAEARLLFTFRDRQYQFTLPLPDPAEKRFHFTHLDTYSPRPRSADAAHKAWEQACAEQWRALLLLIKALLVGVDQGILSFEQAFFAQLLIGTPTGKQTVFAWTDPQIAPNYQAGQMPALLPGAPGAPHYLPAPRDEAA